MTDHRADIRSEAARRFSGFRRFASHALARLATPGIFRSQLFVLWLAAAGAALFAVTALSATVPEEPITPLPRVSPESVAKVILGERLFRDPRLSRDGRHSCDSCHDLDSNGATAQAIDSSLDGGQLGINTPTVFNAALNFRYNWEGDLRTLESQAAMSIGNPRTMGAGVPAVVARLRADPKTVQAFQAIYGHGPDTDSLLDAIATFERSLLTPDSRFDRWLRGEASALSAEEAEGYQLFKSLGCISCHQGVNIGGNLFSRHGIFRPLASPFPEVLRVPSLRNVAATAPYFHDGSAPTLEDAIRRMGLSQLNSTLTDRQIRSIASYLKTLTGNYRGRPVRAPQ